MNKNSLAVFEDHKIRRIYDEESETWYFSVVDIIQVLIQQPDYQAARKYWNKLKERLKKEGSQSVTNCHRLKLEAADGKKYLTDVADPETLLRLIQSVPSPKAEPIKLWLAKVGYERMQDMADPERSLDRAREFWQQHGRRGKTEGSGLHITQCEAVSERGHIGSGVRQAVEKLINCMLCHAESRIKLGTSKKINKLETLKQYPESFRDTCFRACSEFISGVTINGFFNSLLIIDI